MKSTALLGLALGLTFAGCGSLVRPSPLDPPAHPLLAGLTPSPEPDADFPPLSRRAVVRQARALLGRPGRDDGALLRAVFAGHALATARTSADLMDGSRPRLGRVRVGDILVFVDDDRAPGVGVVVAHAEDGVLEAAAVTRGAVRRVRVDRRRPNRRRAGGRVVNTFIRARRPDDPPGLPYLAGQRLVAVRRIDR